uniref:DNA-dependent protein kinase catalytic subunit n=1 Tax=Apis cerana TaxID=7461 RepID=V9IGC3_APICE
MTLTFENDELNNHECMASICGVLNHIISEEISVPTTDGDIILPKWLKCFLSSITTTNYDNVRLFMLKVILNMSTVFQPYTKFFLQPIMYTTYLYLKKNQLNYIIIDVIEMLIDWQTSFFQKSSDFTFDQNKNTIQQLWEIIIQKVIIIKTKEISKIIYKYNMNMLKTMLEVWHPYLKLPANLDDKMRTAPGATVYLILICFVNGMDKDIIHRNNILEFFRKISRKLER